MIKLYRFEVAYPGMMFTKLTPESNEETFQLFSGRIPQGPPPSIISAGLDKARQWYLYKKFCQFVSEPWQDVMCPFPQGPEPIVVDEEDNQPASSMLPAAEVQLTGRGRGRGRGRGKETTETVGENVSPAPVSRGRGRRHGRGTNRKYQDE